MRYAALAALAALTALSACNRREETATTAAPLETPAVAAAGPLTYEKTTPGAEVSLTLPERTASSTLLKACFCRAPTPASRSMSLPARKAWTACSPISSPGVAPAISKSSVMTKPSNPSFSRR